MHHHTLLKRRLFELVISLAVSAIAQTSSAAPPENDHLALATFYVNHIDPSKRWQNVYGPGSSCGGFFCLGPFLYWDPVHSDTISVTRCGSFMALLLKQAYPALDEGDLHGDVLLHLTGSTSPNAARWHDAIQNEASYDEPNDGTSEPYRFERRSLVVHIEPGDILAAEYDGSDQTSGDSTGHVMLVESIHHEYWALPCGFSSALASFVTVIDSSSGVHGATDSRNPGLNGNTGLGRGTIVLCSNFVLYWIEGWAWSVDSPVYSMSSRHLIAGRLNGPGIGR